MRKFFSSIKYLLNRAKFDQNSSICLISAKLYKNCFHWWTFIETLTTVFRKTPPRVTPPSKTQNFPAAAQPSILVGTCAHGQIVSRSSEFWPPSLPPRSPTSEIWWMKMAVVSCFQKPLLVLLLLCASKEEISKDKCSTWVEISFGSSFSRVFVCVCVCVPLRQF